MSPLLEVRNLHVGYPVAGGLISKPSPLTIVRDVSFILEAGQTLGIVGESGCGKSTLGRAILHLNKPLQGQVLWEGRDLAAFSSEELRKRRSEMQIIFQDPVAALDPRMTLGRIVSRPLATFEPDVSKTELNTRAIEALRTVGLSADFANRYPHELSGGQAQRVGIARAIIGRPKLIVCDEPVSALDVSIQAQVINLLMDLQQQMGLSLIFISHNLAVVRHISHHIMVMCLGRTIESASRDAFYAKPLHPYAQALKAAVPEPDPVTERLRIGKSLSGELPSILLPPPGCVFAGRCPVVAELCRTTRPELLAHPGGRQVACHFVEDPQ
jgi:oligopeptide transport system ATP-binding protein